MPRIPEQFKCDHPGCGLERTEANHWWLLSVEMRKNEPVLIVRRWHDWTAKRKGTQFFCGVKHMLAAVNRWAGEVGGAK